MVAWKLISSVERLNFYCLEDQSCVASQVDVFIGLYMCEVNELVRIDAELEVIHVCVGINKFYNRERELSGRGKDVVERKVCFLFIKGAKTKGRCGVTQVYISQN